MNDRTNGPLEGRSLLLVLAPLFWTQLPPLGLAYLEEYLRSRGEHPDIYDMNIDLFRALEAPLKQKWKYAHERAITETFFSDLQKSAPLVLEKALSTLTRREYAVFGFSVFRSNLKFSLECARRVKSLFPESRVVFGGPEISTRRTDRAFFEKLETSGLVDALIIGEGEETLADYVQNPRAFPFCIEGKESLSLDALPFPRFEGLCLSRYERTRALPILASRGCVKKCAFCSERELFHSYRARSARHIIEELEWHIAKKRTLWFTFHDSLINGDLKILRALCEEIIARSLSIRWEAQLAIRPDMGEDLICLMKEAGCFNFFIGLESGSARVLERLKKGYTPDEAEDFFKKCSRASMHFEVSLIVAAWDESDDEFQETLTFLKRNKDIIPKIAQINPCMILPGSEYGRTYFFDETSLPRVLYPDKGRERVKECIAFFKENNFTYTAHFINNLAYEE